MDFLHFGNRYIFYFRMYQRGKFKFLFRILMILCGEKHGIQIGNDVLIAPNTLVNRDVPDHSVVIGNPMQIHHKENATQYYIEY